MVQLSFKLSTLLKDIANISQIDDCDINSITLNSREVEGQGVFVALKGLQVHGLAYAEAAQDNGAVAVIWESDKTVNIPALSIPLIEVENLRDYLGLIAERFYHSSSNKMLSLIGITGTDGKTSVSHFLAQSMEQCAVIGTIGLGTLDNLQQATHTTPDVLSMHKNLSEMREQGIKAVAMEVSSHALDQGRVDNVAFDVAVLTNLSRDHLDYHKTIEAYATAKEKLFLWPDLKGLVINLDDAFGVAIASQKSIKNRGGVFGYGIGRIGDYPQGSLVAQNAKFTHQGLSADIHFGEQTGVLKAPVLGRFNLSNLLAALGAMLVLEFSLDDALVQLNKVHTVAGRMEKVADAEFLTVVDYAHTPNALATVLKALREHTTHKLICVFGCGGDRDAGKRPLMAAAAEKNADVVIVTDDNPRTESPEKIMQDIMTGFSRPQRVRVEHDRARAIDIALKLAKAGDAVLIAGKGHESVQILANGTIPFSDREQANKVLQELAA